MVSETDALQDESQRLPVTCMSTSQPEGGSMGICGWVITILMYIFTIATMPFSLIWCLKIVQEYERAVIFRLGRILSGGARGPGVFFVLPKIDKFCVVDLRTVSFDVPPQEVLTRDSVTVTVDAVVYFRISNATLSVTNILDAPGSTKLLAQSTLRNMIGNRNLIDILTDREGISSQMQMILDEASDAWGMRVERVEMKDVRLPVQLQRVMAAEAEASREANAKLIMAEGEVKSSTALRRAADVIAESPAAMQLRYLQTLNVISAEKNSTIVFPLPTDFLAQLTSKKDVRLPVQLQRVMAAEAEASREANAKLIMAEGEVKSSTALRRAADVIAESPAAMQLRYLQTLNVISAEKNSTIVFPLPTDFLAQLTSK